MKKRNITLTTAVALAVGASGLAQAGLLESNQTKTVSNAAELSALLLREALTTDPNNPLLQQVEEGDRMLVAAKKKAAKKKIPTKKKAKKKAVKKKAF